MPTPALVGNSPALVSVLEQARRLAAVPRPLLIYGERGTGKELLAGFIHAHGPAPEGPFVAVNCAVYNDELLASELFGHTKGAFTGAHAAHDGCLQRAGDGTLFFDEVGNMSQAFQGKLLRVIETRRYEAVGGTQSRTVEARFVFATNSDLRAMAEQGEFRMDFYDRIAFEVLTLPPLRERREDIPLLVEHFAQQLLREIPNLEQRRFSRPVLQALAEYYWPGNVRELKSTVERLLLQEGESDIRASELPLEITGSAPIGETFDEKVEGYKRHLILTAWRDCNGSQRRAARQLGMSYDQFRHYFRKYHLRELAP